LKEDKVKIVRICFEVCRAADHINDAKTLREESVRVRRPSEVGWIFGEEDEELLSDEVTVEAIDEALAVEEGLRLSQEVVSEIERLMLASSAASDSLRDGLGENVEVIQMDDDESDDDEDLDEDGELLATAITRLSGTDDPVGLSHIVGGVVQLSNAQRQELLEAPDALTRLRLLDQHLQREQLLLSEGVRPWTADPRAIRNRRN
jgi:hypothetical protein